MPFSEYFYVAIWKTIVIFEITQPAITRSKLTIETLEQGVKHVQS